MHSASRQFAFLDTPEEKGKHTVSVTAIDSEEKCSFNVYVYLVVYHYFIESVCLIQRSLDDSLVKMNSYVYKDHTVRAASSF